MRGQESRGKMLVEMSVTDMGSISLALDYYLNSGGLVRDNPDAWQDLQKRWDELYKSTHRCLDLGVRSLQGS